MKIRILQVLGSLRYGGAESRIMDVYRHIDRSQFEFDFLIFDKGDQPFEQEVYSLGGKVFKLNSPSIRRIASVIKQIRTIMANGQYDVVHAHVSYFSGLVLMAAKYENIPIRICHARTAGTTKEGLHGKFGLALGKSLIRVYATHCLAVSDVAGKYLYGNRNYEVVVNAIDVAKYLNIWFELIINDTRLL